MTVYADVPLAQVQPHPNNVRRSAVADDDMVASVASAGIHEPVLLGPEVDGIRYLIAGNRRYDAAVKAGLTEIPALLRDDLATEAQQIEVMLVENLHRQDLTAVEEADAYEQLQLFGMDAKAIAAATGRSVATVKQRLTLSGLSADAREAVHTGEATLTDALTLLEFAGDAEAEEVLSKFLGTSEFAWKAKSLRAERDRAAENAARIADFEVRGIPEWDRGAHPHGRALSNLKWTAPHLEDEDAHPECLGWFVTSYREVAAVCMDPDSHPAPEMDPEEKAAREAEDAAREAAAEVAAQHRAERAAARSVRLDVLRDVVVQVLPAKGKAADALAEVLRAALPTLLVEGDVFGLTRHGIIDEALGFNDGSWAEKQHQATEKAVAVAAGPTHLSLDTLARILAALIENNLSMTRHTRPDRADSKPHAASAWEWLAGTGYILSSIDEQVRAEATGSDDDVEGEAA